MRDFRRVFMILYAAVVFTSLFRSLQAHGGIAVNTSYTDVTNNPGVSGRVYATFYNPNNFAEILVLLMPCAFVAFMTEERITPAAKALIGLSFVLPVVALVLTSLSLGVDFLRAQRGLLYRACKFEADPAFSSFWP